jgi:radical SAM protein with 4Fe4S-binding SPASM domain
MIALDYKGDIYPCVRYMESSLGDTVPPLIIGNVRDGVAQSEACKLCIHSLKSVDRLSQSTEECINCRIAEGCAWCTAYNYQVFGTPDKRATYICIMHKARALANVYFWNKWYLKSGEKQYFKNNVPDDWALEIIDEEELRKLTQLEQEAKFCAEES